MTSDAGDTGSEPTIPTSIEHPTVTGHVTWLLIMFAVSGWAYVDIWTANRESLLDFFPTHFLAWSSLFFFAGLAVTVVLASLLTGPSRWDRAYAGGFLCVLGIQSWDRTSELFSRISGTMGSLGALVLVGLGFAVATWLFLRLFTPGRPGRAFVFVVAAFLVGWPYLLVTQSGLAGLFGASSPPPVTSTAVAEHTGSDVLIVVLDGYGSGEVLSTRFGYDNAALQRRLQESGVDVVEGAKSNYSLTALSIAGLLEGRYPALGSPADADLEQLQHVHAGENTLFRTLRRSGYEVHLFDNPWTFTRCGTTVDVCHAASFNELDHAVLGRTPAFDLFPSLRISPWIRGSVDQLRKAAELASQPSDSPRLIYLHSLIPHEPFQLDADCTERWDPSLSRYDLSSSEDVPGQAYIEQVRCVNDLVVDLITAMPPDALILITGDHGPRWAGADPARAEATDLQVLTRIGVLTAYRFPASCEEIPDDVSVMAVTAAMFSCIGVPIDAEADRDPRQPSRYFSHGDPGERIEVIDITDRVEALP